MKPVVVYFSLSGNTEFAAKQIAIKLNADLIKLRLKKEMKKEGFGTYFLGGMSSVFNKKPALANPVLKLDKYKTVLSGAPIWAGRLAAPINTFLASNKLEGTSVYLFACSAGGSPARGFSLIKKKLSGAEIKGTALFVNPLKNKDESSKIDAFCQAVLKENP
jgi:flavodoxin